MVRPAGAPGRVIHGARSVARPQPARRLLSRRVRHIVTCEYPPLVGGVADYTTAMAAELAGRGETVHVWVLAAVQPQGGPGVHVHALGGYARAHLRDLDRALAEHPGPRTLFIQWVPHGYGYKSLNVPFCWWVRRRRARAGDVVDLMVHEPYLRFSSPDPRHLAAAAVHRGMLAMLCSAARHVWTSTPAFVPMVASYGLGRPARIESLPVPSPLARVDDRAQLAAIRRTLGAPAPIYGHFGSYNRLITPALRRLTAMLLDEDASARLVLLGHGGDDFARSLRDLPVSARDRLIAPGRLAPDTLSSYLQACDVFVQPYPDGVSRRRTTVMALLHHGRAVVTVRGAATEAWWAEQAAACLVLPSDEAALLREARVLAGDQKGREALEARAAAAYEDSCTVQVAVDQFLAAEP